MKKIIFFLLLGAVVGYIVKAHNGDRFIPFQTQSDKTVHSASTSAAPKSFALIQKEVKKLSVSDIATASPQMKTIINLLKKMPGEQAKVICQNVCNGIQ